MPQLDTTTFSSQLFWLGVCFLVLYFVLSYLLIPKMAGILEDRETIREEKINLASTYREQAEGLLMAYEKALAQARKDALSNYQSFANEVVLEMAEKKREMLEKMQERLHIAEQELYRARLEASKDIQSVAQDIAGEILQKLTAHTYPVDQLFVKKDQE
jgi:F-type H+-transporting ATPase subunit b